MPKLRFTYCDVFTDRPLAGNQLAVFTGAGGVDDRTLQAIALEIGFSETVFVFPASAGGHARLRIFMPQREVPFAGHPVLGSAFVIGTTVQVDELRLETGAGMVPVRLEREGARVVHGWMTQPLPRRVPFDAGDALLAALGVARSELPIEAYDNGIGHVYVALASADEVARLAPDLRALAALPATTVSTFAPLDGAWKTRVFAPAGGVPEDAATGSAAGPLAWHLARHGRVPFGEVLTIHQGVELGRPSQLAARTLGDAEAATAIEVGGAAVIVARGELVL